jgi:hypothetical protein
VIPEGVTLIFVTDSEQIEDHVNQSRGSDDKITHVSVFAHGLAGQVALGYQTNTSLNISIGDIQNYNSSGFSSNVSTIFYSCNTGTVSSSYGTGFAQAWVNQVGGQARAVVNGKTDYQYINKGRGLMWNSTDKLNRSIGINFDTTGSKNFPVISSASSGAYWGSFYKNKNG